MRGWPDLSFGSIPVPVSPPISNLDGEGIAKAWKGGLEFIRAPDGKYVANAFRKVVYLRFTPASDTSPDVQRLRALLRLTADRYNFEFMNAMDTWEEKKTNAWSPCSCSTRSQTRPFGKSL